MIAAILLSLTALQAPEGEQPEPLILNRIDLIVNEECITSAEIESQMRSLGRDASTAEELTQLHRRVVSEQVSYLLKVGAGRDAGFRQEMIDGYIRLGHEARLEQAQSAARMADLFVSSRFDASSYYEYTERSVYAHLWTESVTGRAPGAGGRVYVDRWVRPGRMKLEYDRRDKVLPAEVTIQVLYALPRVTGTLESARILAERCREEILAGEDFGQVAVDNECADEETKGVSGPWARDHLLKTAGVGEFIATAQSGDISEVLPVREEGALRGFRVIKVLDQKDERTVAFANEELQAALKKQLLESLDRRHESQALNSLLGAAYVWPPFVADQVPENAE
jgi:hypothetical protein